MEDLLSDGLVIQRQNVEEDILLWWEAVDKVPLGRPEVLQHDDPDHLQVPDQPHLVLRPRLQLVCFNFLKNAIFQQIQAHFSPFPGPVSRKEPSLFLLFQEM